MDPFQLLAAAYRLRTGLEAIVLRTFVRAARREVPRILDAWDARPPHPETPVDTRTAAR